MIYAFKPEMRICFLPEYETFGVHYEDKSFETLSLTVFVPWWAASDKITSLMDEAGRRSHFMFNKTKPPYGGIIDLGFPIWGWFEIRRGDFHWQLLICSAEQRYGFEVCSIDHLLMLVSAVRA